METNELAFNNYIKKTWNEAYTANPKLFNSKLEFLKKKSIGKFTLLINYDKNSRRKESDLDFLLKNEENEEEVDSVYQNFDEEQQNFNMVNQEEVLFYMDLDQEEIITKKEFEIIDENEIQDGEKVLEREISKNSLHPVIINSSFAVKNHSILPLFPIEDLPQVIGSDIILILFQIFKISGAPDLRLF